MAEDVSVYEKEYFLYAQQGIKDTHSELKGKFSDGAHTFDELYRIRATYNAVLFNEWGEKHIKVTEYSKKGEEVFHREFEEIKPKYDVHKSLKHHDGELCFGGGWFIVVAILPTGQISNHYPIEEWDMFKIPEVEKAKYEFDGHTSEDVINRLKEL